MIDKSQPLPLHYQITMDLRNKIREGYWSVGDLFPTDKDLMEQYGVSSTTIRRAVSELVNEGWLKRQPGKGTFVTKEFVETVDDGLRGFFEEVKAKGMIPSADVLSMNSFVVDENICEHIPGLQVFKDSKVFVIEKVHRIDGNPVTYVKSYWPYDIGSKISEYDLSLRGMYEVLEVELKISLEKAEQLISSKIADEREAKALEVLEKSPVLLMERVAYAQGKPIEFSHNVYRADRYRYRLVLERNQPKNGGIVLDK
ncbi:GntR family transcriptional regulator [Desulfitibacter alkalitolerans]|uniref:GntR family transcriptional regulator n=1 Tax=Desulfitibacter alkalitolerans TaxID=264641 RepID=UPI0005525760|nr:GntR family transcriptional regulator [Desulfitibacter alkalitolerans]